MPKFHGVRLLFLIDFHIFYHFFAIFILCVTSCHKAHVVLHCETLKTDKIMLFATLVFVGLTAGIYNIISGEQEV